MTWDAYFVDGTTMEANANRYTYVCKKNVQGNQAKLTEVTARLKNDSMTKC